MGQLGYGNTENIGDDEHPFSAGDVDIGGLATTVVGSEYFTCALLQTGEVRCWGIASGHMLGSETQEPYIGDDELPSSWPTVPLPAPAIGLASGGGHSLALLADGTVVCWGWNTVAECGIPELAGTTNLGPEDGVVDVGSGVVQVVAGTDHSCALYDSGELRCFGANYFGQLGYPVDTALCGTPLDDTFACENASDCCVGDDEAPIDLDPVDVGGMVIAVAAGAFHTCALLEDGSLRCFGWNVSGQLGYGQAGADLCGTVAEQDFECTRGLWCCIGDDETPAEAGDVPVL
jgi:alpha-tubulin suppressor-like RCC1 family protein